MREQQVVAVLVALPYASALVAFRPENTQTIDTIIQVSIPYGPALYDFKFKSE